MTYLLFFRVHWISTALTLAAKRLQQGKNDYAVAQQRLKEIDKRLQEVDRKYGGL
ncbi:DUF4041 domain-containing protein, partial [Nostoc sp. HG1]|nr:DUF4041 domain-containing protein [Nostoc sp. HG1]